MAKKEKTFSLTFFDIAYSLGGRSNVDKIYKVLNEIYVEESVEGSVPRNELLSDEEFKVLGCMVDTYKRDKIFPSWTYLQEAYNIVSNAPVRNMGDFNSAIYELFATRQKDYMSMYLSDAMAKAHNVEDLKAKTEETLGKFKKTTRVNNIKTFGSVQEQYDFAKSAPQGISTGVRTVDLLTAGFQQGTVASVAGFTSHGKSTLSNNIAYINASMGRKVGVVSLEIVPLLCKYIYLSRHSVTMGKPIEYQTLIRTHLTEDERRAMFAEIEPDFIEKVGKNLAIIGTEDVPEYSYAGFELLYEQLEEALGGLDLVIWDHVNQFKYVNPGSNLTGDHYIKFLTDLTKTFKNRKGNHPVSLFVVQTNREGWRRAARHDGRYELTALSDFNELEKSSTYVIFVYADEQQRHDEQAKVQLLKHRLGMLMLEPEMTEVQFKYSMVGKNFVDVVSTISTEREGAINGMFFSGGGSSSDFSLDSSEFADLSSIKETKPSNVEVTIGVQEEPKEDKGYQKKIVSVSDDDFVNM